MHLRIASQSDNFDWPGGLSLQIVCLVWSDLLFPRTRCSFSVSNFPRFLPTPVTKVFSPLYLLYLLFLSFSFTHSPSFSLSPSPSVSIFLALFASADNKIPAADRDGKENIFWRRKLSRTRHRKHKQQLERREGRRKEKEKDGRWKEERETRNFLSLCNERRNLHTAKYIIKRSASSFSSSSPENVSDLRFLLVWSAEIPGYTILDKVHFTIVAHKWVLQNTYIYIYTREYVTVYREVWERNNNIKLNLINFVSRIKENCKREFWISVAVIGLMDDWSFMRRIINSCGIIGDH